MGACCSNSTVDGRGDINTMDYNSLKTKMTLEQVALLIKIQAHVRGFLTRKKIRQMQYNAGMGGYVHDGEMNDYENVKVQVSNTSILTTSTANQRRAWRVRLP